MRERRLPIGWLRKKSVELPLQRQLLLVFGKIAKLTLSIHQATLTLPLRLRGVFGCLMERWWSLTARWVSRAKVRLFGAKPISTMCRVSVLLIRSTRPAANFIAVWIASIIG